jgi:type I restriction enzyme M protein
MAIKKSQLYSSIWKSCDELRGGMDASQYKDYVLVLLFIKYISDKYAGVRYAPIVIPKGASFTDMVALKGNPEIGDLINKKIIDPIARENKLTEMPDFNNPEKLGSGQDMVKKLSNLIAIFENPALDFSNNRAGGDDILGDAYEYLMRHFATESGKSKGQFYTPAEVSRVMAQVIGIAHNATTTTTVYDPTCGSGSLLLKVADEADKKVALYGQENDTATAGLARMNMILHNNPTADIRRENTIASPLFLETNRQLKTFDYVVANPPFSFKSWSNGIDPTNDAYGRFRDYGIPPAKNGDYAFLLHIVRSLKSRGKGAVILPHGVLFRGNGESEIRKNLIRKGYIKGIIGLPANLFYGTGIPACIIVLDKENADNRKGIFMIDASKGFVKDGNKNRLRAQDIHKIVDVFNKQIEIPKYSRMVSTIEIEEKNDFNLNLPRYIDSQESEDIQDIEAHLKGDIPDHDINDLESYWSMYPSLKRKLFTASNRKGYSKLIVPQDEIIFAVFSHPEFVKYAQTVHKTFLKWKEKNTIALKKISKGVKPKQLIREVSEDILATFANTKLVDKYDIFQHLMEYWTETMQDDMYIIAVTGWKAELAPVDGKKSELDSDLVPKYLVVNRYFPNDKKTIDGLVINRDAVSQQLLELEEEHGDEEGFLGQFEKVNKINVAKRIKDIKKSPDEVDELKVLDLYLKLAEEESELNRKIKESTKALDVKVLQKYKTLTEAEIKTLVVDDKWVVAIEETVKNEMDRVSQALTRRIKELAERYAIPLPRLVSDTAALSKKVDDHLKKMGFKV